MELWGAAVVRWLHLTGAVLVLGSLLCAVMHSGSGANRYRLLLGAAMLSLVATGLVLWPARPAPRPTYHLWLGIKVLLAAHIFVVLLRSMMPGSPRPQKKRAFSGALVAGWIVLLIAAYLHQIR